MNELAGWMRTFVAVADAGSFSRAALRLEITQSSVSRQVSALEKHLGAQLLQRTTRSIALTAEGSAFFEAALRALAAIDEAEAAVGLHGALSGQVRLTAPLTLAQSRLIAMLARFQQKHPRIEVDLRLSDHALNLVSDNLDFAIRVGAIGDSRNIARRIGRACRVMVAAPAYAAAHGLPQRPAELGDHNCLSYSLLATGTRWSLTGHAPVDIRGNFRADSPDALRAAALAGAGIAVNARWLFEQDIAQGRLIEVLPDFPPLDMPIHLTMPPGRYVAARVRALADFLIDAFVADPRLRIPEPAVEPRGTCDANLSAARCIIPKVNRSMVEQAASDAHRRPHVVIVGAGFGGLAAAQALAKAPVDITVIDKRNHHLFQPLLYQVATAGLSPADIAESIRSILSRQANARVLLDRVYGIDRAAQKVILGDGEPLTYDWLIIATGARHSYFGRDDWEQFAPGIKTIEDATKIRRKVLIALEKAETETDKARRDALLTFVVIGGGPTGVEMAGAIAELSRQSVSKDFRHITPNCARIILIQRGDRLLPSFPLRLSAKAHESIEQLGVEVVLDVGVEEISADGVVAGGQFISTATTIWAAGVTASRAAEWLGMPGDQAGRVSVGSDLHPAGESHIFVIGDTAACIDASGRALPGVAPVAKQQGQYAARAIRSALKGRTIADFRYRDYGNMATIGRSHAVADLGFMTASGFPAWVLWCAAHIYFLTGFRNRISVGISWLWNYLTFQRGARLITGDVAPDLPAVTALAPVFGRKAA